MLIRRIPSHFYCGMRSGWKNHMHDIDQRFTAIESKDQVLSWHILYHV